MIEEMEKEETRFYQTLEQAEEESMNFKKVQMMKEFEMIQAADEDEKDKSVRKRNQQETNENNNFQNVGSGMKIEMKSGVKSARK